MTVDYDYAAAIRRYERKKDLALLTKIALIIASLVAIYLWIRNPEQKIQTVPPFYQGTWKNASHGTGRFIIITPTGLMDEKARQITQPKRGHTLRIYLDARILEISHMGEDLIHVGELIPTGMNDDMGYIELGIFARH